MKIHKLSYVRTRPYFSFDYDLQVIRCCSKSTNVQSVIYFTRVQSGKMKAIIVLATFGKCTFRKNKKNT